MFLRCKNCGVCAALTPQGLPLQGANFCGFLTRKKAFGSIGDSLHLLAV